MRSDVSEVRWKKYGVRVEVITLSSYVEGQPRRAASWLLDFRIWIRCLCSSVVRLWHPMACSPPCSSVDGTLQARVLEWVAICFSRGSSQPRDQTRVSYISSTAGRFFTTEPPGKPMSVVGWFFFCFLKKATNSLPQIPPGGGVYCKLHLAHMMQAQVCKVFVQRGFPLFCY